MAEDKFERPPIDLINAYKSGAGRWFLTLWSYLQGLSSGGGGGYTDLTEFVDQSGYKLFYSDNLGDVQELTHGAENTFLRSTGASGNPAWTALTMSHLTNQNNYKLFYSNGSGEVTELTPGASGTYLKSLGDSSAPTWDTPSSSSDLERVHLEQSGSTTSIGGGAGAAIPIGWNYQRSIDTDTFTHSTVTNNSRITVDETGRYHVKCSIIASHTTNETKEVWAGIRVNGSTYYNRSAYVAHQVAVSSGTSYVAFIVDAEVDLSANDYIEVCTQVLRASGTGALTTVSGSGEVVVTRIE